MPALLFLPFVVGPLRTATRVAAFGVALLAWAAAWQAGRREVGRPNPARPWLTLAMAWLLLSIFHPLSNSPMAAAAEAGLTIAIFSPVFWVGHLEVSSRRLGRLLVLLFLFCSASALVGIAQFYYPGRFDPPNMVLERLNPEAIGGLYYMTADGRRVMRPFGLTDSPGGAVGAGQVAFLLGLGLALQSGARWWWRLLCLALAAAGMAIIYFTQVRQALIVSLLAALAMAVLFALRGEKRRALLLVGAGASIFAAGLLWALRAGGAVILERFRGLLEGNLVTTYYVNRGHFVQYALTELLPQYPIGAGLGRWGMTHAYFGTPRPIGAPGASIWCEDMVTAWVVQGGVVMLVLAFGALTVVMLDMVRIVRTTPDRDLAVWAVVITAVCCSILTSVFGSVPFVAPKGLTFWLLAAGLHAADQRARAERNREARRIAQARAAFGPPAPPPPGWPVGARPR